MEITSVEPQNKNPHRFNIFLDGKFAFGADEDLVVERRLVVDKEISPADLEKILFETEVGKLMERVYGLLSRRMRSEKEIRDYLRNLSFKRKIKEKEEISELVISKLIEKLKKKNLINDREFAKKWVESRRISKKKSKRALMAELLQKGLDREDIVEALGEEDSQSEEKLALEALERKIGRWKNLSDLEKKKKMYEFLLRRGFEYEIIKHAVDKYFEK